MVAFQAISDEYTYFMTVLADPRMEDKFLMSSPFPTIGIIFFYIALVKLILPYYMKSRPAYNLDSVIFYYNWFQIILSSIMVYKSYGSGYVRRFSLFKCRDLDQSTTDPDALMALSAVYLFFLSKFMEFFDTIFFVLRKKFNQVSFLHMFHHATMPLNIWIAAKIFPGGSSALGVGINASVHVLMYTYYMLSGLGPRWQKYLWWKKYITIIQLIQFWIGVILFTNVILDQSECPAISLRTNYAKYALAYICVLIYLFGRFYIQTYNRKRQNVNGVEMQKKMQKIE